MKTKFMIYDLRFKNIVKKILAVLILNFAFLTLSLNEVNAQTINPSVWQTQATGLQTQNNTGQKTAGIVTTVSILGTPFMVLQGGVTSSGGRLTGPSSIDLGQIKIQGTDTYNFVSESADWAHNEVVLSNNLRIWSSRLTPATLIQNQNSSLRIFSGNLNGNYWGNPPWGGSTPYLYNRNPAPSYPKYVAYSSGGNIQIQAIPASGATVLSLPALDNNWIMVWYGNNSHFADTKAPVAYSNNAGHSTPTLPHSEAYQADAPILLKFESNPSSIIQSPEGGIDLSFSGNSGYTSTLPLFGREHLQASDTEGWGSSGSLPADVISKINFWNTNNRLCSYPTQVSETYSYDSDTDTSTISENITYLPVCSGGLATSGFAILPPMMALTMITPDQQGNTNPLGITVSGTLTNANYPTEFGPIVGVDNTNAYSWSVSGLRKYTDSKRVITSTGQAPTELIQELQTEVQKIIDAGHFAPWIYIDSLARRDSNGDIYFLNPADNLYHLSEIAKTLPDSQLKTDFINYIQNERNTYSPETVFNLPNSGTMRPGYSIDGTRASEYGGRNMYEYIRNNLPGSDVFNQRTPLYNLYALAKYYELSQAAVPTTVLDQSKTILNEDMKEQDWATSFWFKSFSPKRISGVALNRHLAGLIGFVKLNEGDIQAESLGRSLLTKALVGKIAMTKYPRYLYNSNLFILPSNPTWQPTFTADAESWRGYIFNYNWTGAYDDPLQVVMLDEYSLYLNDSSGFGEPGSGGRDWGYATGGHLIGYRDMTPEVGRLLRDYVKQDAEIYLQKMETFAPNWYQSFSEAVVGQEHNMSHPIDSFQLFMAKAFIQNDSPDNLRKYRDIPWLQAGDLFYVHKLAETIKAYQGWAWEDETYLTTDINQDLVVDANDILELFNNWNIPRNRRSDVNQDGLVNGIDFSLVIKDLGKTQ